MKMPRFKAPPTIRKAVFWASLLVMLIAAPVGMVARLTTREWGVVPQASLALGLGALLVALVFWLLELTNPMFHPESDLFSWDDVDELRKLARRTTDAEERAWARSLAERIAVVLPGRAHGERRPHERIRNPERIDQRDR